MNFDSVKRSENTTQRIGEKFGIYRIDEIGEEPTSHPNIFKKVFLKKGSIPKLVQVQNPQRESSH
jgi:hypothetical protein